MTLLRLLLVAATFFFTTAMSAQIAQADTTVDDLIAQQRLTIATRLLPDSNIMVGQKLALEITIATDRWFKGGTRIRLPEVPGLVILQTEQFASNASEQRQGESWVVQRWSVDVYPQNEGTFRIPGIALELSVAGAGLEAIAGTAETDSLSFTAAIPPGLTADDSWVAAPAFSVTQRFDREVMELTVGDALEQTVVLVADNVMAMMLPDYAAPTLEGLKAYPLPPQLSNSSNRGQASARRVETISYIAQAPGVFLLPARDFHWWNTTRDELDLVSLPPVKVVITGTPESQAGPGINLRLLAAIVVLLAFIVGALWVLHRWLPALPWQRLIAPFQTAMEIVKQLRKPALPLELNPADTHSGQMERQRSTAKRTSTEPVSRENNAAG